MKSEERFRGWVFELVTKMHVSYFTVPGLNLVSTRRWSFLLMQMLGDSTDVKGAGFLPILMGIRPEFPAPGFCLAQYLFPAPTPSNCSLLGTCAVPLSLLFSISKKSNYFVVTFFETHTGESFQKISVNTYCEEKLGMDLKKLGSS